MKKNEIKDLLRYCIPKVQANGIKIVNDWYGICWSVENQVWEPINGAGGPECGVLGTLLLMQNYKPLDNEIESINNYCESSTISAVIERNIEINHDFTLGCFDGLQNIPYSQGTKEGYDLGIYFFNRLGLTPLK